MGTVVLRTHMMTEPMAQQAVTETARGNSYALFTVDRRAGSNRRLCQLTVCQSDWNLRNVTVTILLAELLFGVTMSNCHTKIFTVIDMRQLHGGCCSLC